MRWVSGTRQSVKRRRASGCGAITSMREAISKPGVSGIDDERRDAARPRRFAGAREHHVEVGDATVGNPGLFAVDHRVVALDVRAALHGGYIGARLRFGQCERRDRFAACHPRQIALFLFDRALQADRARTQALHGEGEVGQPAVTRQRLPDQADGPRVDHVRHAVRPAAHRVLEPSGAAERKHQGPALVVEVGAVMMRHVGDRPCIELARQLAVPLFEKRPVEVTGIAHGRLSVALLIKSPVSN